MSGFPDMKNDLLLKAARGEPITRTPVWVMRQAGRYLPEFKEVRAEADFFRVCQTAELACKVTLQPLARFELDGAIIFSDILVIPQALGMTVEMIPGKGPVFPEPLATPDDLKKLKSSVDVTEALGYVFEALSLTRHQIDGQVPLFGFCGGPWTLMSYMIEGGGSKNFSKCKGWLYKYPDASHELLKIIEKVSVNYLVEQVRAGAQLLQVFESWAGELSPEAFAEFSLPYLSRICTSVKMRLRDNSLEEVPMIIFAKGAHYALEDLASTDYDVIQIDWTVEPASARARVGPNKTLQGNMDPYGSDDTIRREAEKMVKGFGVGRHIANLGHGMHPTHDPAKLKVFIDAVHAASDALHAASKY